MVYISLLFYLFIVILLIAYYALPMRYRWLVLLGGSIFFYYWQAKKVFVLFLLTILVSYALGRYIGYLRNNNIGRKKIYCFCWIVGAIIIVVVPLLVMRNGNSILQKWLNMGSVSLIVPLGISFYTLQIIAYLVDVYNGKVEPQRNIFKYALFISFFPNIIQGPIPRYKQLQTQLIEGHKFEEKEFVKGIHLIIWGFFLKLMIADKAGVVVDTVFNNYCQYAGGYIWIAGCLYSIQLYADFMACSIISKGVSELFGIEIVDNFIHPYKATSIKDFWRRWHISLSTWLRDYIYIPLGGNRKGKFAKYRNLIITFAVSGIWHGVGFKYLFWGLLHAFYQVMGEIFGPINEKLLACFRTPKGLFRKTIQTIITFIFVMLGWIIFRADSLKIGLGMIYSMFTVYNPWIFFDDSIFSLGLAWKEWGVLIGAMLILAAVGGVQEKICIRDWILEQHIVVRWGIYVLAIWCIWVLGTYGYGFNAQDFIYGGF